MSNARIQKKKHTNLLADFLIEASQDADWAKKMKELALEGKLDTSELGFPEFFNGFFPEAKEMKLEFSIERLNYADSPRTASRWWPAEVEGTTSYFVAYPTQFPQSSIYMAIDFDDEHDHEH